VVHTLYEENKIVLSREALSEEDLREESVLNATDRVLLSLLDGPSYPADLQEKTNLAGVGNIITKLKRKELLELTGQKVGKADEVVLTEKGQGLAEVIRSRLSSSLSSYHRTPLVRVVMMKQMKVVELLHHHLNPLVKVVMMKKNLRRPKSPRAPKKRKSSGPS
jgi:hypothetical protein